MKFDTIIIGAGAAGVYAAQQLSKAGNRVCLLEAAAVAGGRIATVCENGFDEQVETGAEFVHGRLPLTLSLLNGAALSYTTVAGKIINVRQGEWWQEEAHDPDWNSFMQQLAQLKTDMTLEQFLQKHFSGKQYSNLRKAAIAYAEGFDLADIHSASALALQQEWVQGEEAQYRITGGYQQLINFLLQECTRFGTEVHYNSCVQQVEYTNRLVTVYTTGGHSFNAAKLLITVSAGVLQSGALQFSPAMDHRYTNAVSQLGFGQVIKILLKFRTTFWKNFVKDIGFLLSDEAIPTWWTQLPADSNLLTGWLGGPGAATKQYETSSAILDKALHSLSGIFNMPQHEIQDQLQHHTIVRWQQHPFVLGGYSYNTVAGAEAKKILQEPINNLIFFAGEALYEGQPQGTVEAALQSVVPVIKKILAGTGRY